MWWLIWLSCFAITFDSANCTPDRPENARQELRHAISDYEGGQYDDAELCLVPEKAQSKEPCERSGDSQLVDQKGDNTWNDSGNEITEFF